MALSTVIAAGTPQSGGIADHPTVHNTLHGVYNTHFDTTATVAGFNTTMFNTGVTRLGDQTYSATDMWTGLGVAISGPLTLGSFQGKVAGTPSDGNWLLTSQPSVVLSRHEYIPAASENTLNNTLWIYHENHADTDMVGSKANQPVGLNVSVKGRGDSAGATFSVTNVGDTGDHASVAFGVFTSVVGTNSAGKVNPGAQGFATSVVNNTGVDYGWADTSHRYSGFDVAFGGSGGKQVGTGVQLRGGLLGAGYTLLPGTTVATAGFIDASNSPTVLRVEGTHTTVVDLSAATITGNAWSGALTTDNLIQSTRATGSIFFALAGTGAGANTWKQSMDASGNFNLSDAAFRFQIDTGTPGAGNTGLHIIQGAGPTLSQIKYKAGNTLGAGDNVLYF